MWTQAILQGCSGRTASALCGELGVLPALRSPCLPQDIFRQVIAQGKLTPGVLRAFQASGHEEVSQAIHSLNIQDVPAILPLTRNLWLGDKPGYY